jgi:hypothetical protein
MRSWRIAIEQVIQCRISYDKPDSDIDNFYIASGAKMLLIDPLTKRRIAQQFELDCTQWQLTVRLP